VQKRVPLVDGKLKFSGRYSRQGLVISSAKSRPNVVCCSLDNGAFAHALRRKVTTMKHFVLIATGLITTWSISAQSQDETIKVTSDLQDIVAKELAQGAPAQSVGIDTTNLGAIPLDPYFETMSGFELRVREVTLQPGGRIAAHSHETRPVSWVNSIRSSRSFPVGSIRQYSGRSLEPN